MTLFTKEDFTELFDVSRETFEKVSVYHDLLLKWNKAINLVSPKTLDEAWHRHLIDSAQVEKYIQKNIQHYADLGCGGGFPGLLIAMMRPDLNVHLVESDERKCQFMRNVSRETSLQNVSIHTKRIEQAYDDVQPDFITARALASLDKLFNYCLPWVEEKPDLGFCFMKGFKAQEEITEAQQNFSFNIEQYDSITDENAKILVIKELNSL